MKAKIAVGLTSIIVIYLITLHLFGQSSLYDRSLNFVLEKETEGVKKAIDYDGIYIALKSDQSFLKSHSFDKEYSKLQLIKSETEFNKIQELKQPIIVIIRSGIGAELGLADIGINIVKGKYTTVYYGKKYLWGFFFWVDLKAYEEFATPY